MKIAYIAHPIGGNVEENLFRIKQICRHINLTEPDTVPFAPYFLDCMSLDDAEPVERERGIRNNTELMRRGFIDELRIYGDRISAGMEAEIKLAIKLRIPVRVPPTVEIAIKKAE